VQILPFPISALQIALKVLRKMCACALATPRLTSPLLPLDVFLSIFQHNLYYFCRKISNFKRKLHKHCQYFTKSKTNDLDLKPISKNFYQHFPLNFKHFLNFPLDDDLQNKRLGPQTFFINHPSNFSTKHFSTWLAFWWNGSHSALLAPTQ